MERLDLDGEISNWNAVVHAARYASAKAYCRNRTVLDLACGEGYGSAKLIDWGASSVLGVDISEDAINKAQIRFTSSATKFLQLPADTETFLSQKFDLVVSFETIEHVQDPEQFLTNIKNSMHKDSIAIISCPNDAWYYAYGGSNPFHLHTWTPDEFKHLINKHFGNVKMVFGYPSIGFTNVGENQYLGEKFTSKSSRGEMVHQVAPLSQKESAYYLAYININEEVEATSASTVLGMTSYFGDEDRSFENPGDLIRTITRAQKREIEQDQLILKLSKFRKLTGGNDNSQAGKINTNEAGKAGNLGHQDQLFEKIKAISSENLSNILKAEVKTRKLKKPILLRLKRIRFNSGFTLILLVCYSIYRKLPRNLKKFVKPLGRKFLRIRG